MNYQLSFVGYTVAATSFAVFTVLLLTLWRERMRGSLLAPASLVTVIWAALLAFSSTQADLSISRILLVEIAQDCAWLIFLSSILGGAVAVQSNWLVRRGGVVLGVGLLAIVLVLEFAGLKDRFPGAMGQLLVMGSIATALYALVGIEQLYRNARPSQQNGLKFLCLGLAGMFAYDVFLYSNAVVDGQVRAMFWGARGFVVALCVPLIAISVTRIASWRSGIFASRQIIFYTTTLFAAGIYLSLVGLAGYYIQTLGKEWGDALQLVFFSAAILLFFTLVLSDQLRGRTKVFLTKHFFERKYDYRAEWLRLINTLTVTGDGLPLKKRAIKALAQIVGSHSGYLWWRNAVNENYQVVAAWDTQPIVSSIPIQGELPRFIEDRGWIIDTAEVQARPDKYAPLNVANMPPGTADAAFVIPLLHESELLGMISLSAPDTPVSLNYEDHDLLKTAGQQIASYLAQEEATDQLSESRQFEAFNRFTAFVMHDLKNAIAQQSLVVENAERHKRNPEFIDDAMETIKGSVKRMRRVMRHLRHDDIFASTENVNVGWLVQLAVTQCADRLPQPAADIEDASTVVLANRERLLSGLLHAIRNAQDACDGDGKVTVKVRTDGRNCCIEIADNGCGMEPDFVRDHLFRPFDSTKGAEGMGIGAYQIRETIRAAGGEVSVRTEVGKGTTMTLCIPTVLEEDK